MSISEQWLLDHSKHFHWNHTAFERIIEESEDNDVLFSGFHALWKAKAVFYKSPLMKNLGEKEILQDALDATCDFVRTNTVCELSPLLINVGSYKILEKICFFKTLSTCPLLRLRRKNLRSYSTLLFMPLSNKNSKHPLKVDNIMPRFSKGKRRDKETFYQIKSALNWITPITAE